MAFSNANTTNSIEELLEITTEANILAYYLGINKIPCLIKSPLRRDKSPSFGLYSKNGRSVYFTDFSTKESGGTFDLLGKLWNKNFHDVVNKIASDINKIPHDTNVSKSTNRTSKAVTYNASIDIQCKTREWKDYDIKYWKSFGIPLEWLNYAEVYPISHKIVVKGEDKYVFKADKYAYVYVERKEGKVSLKIYQPFNQDGYKWSNKNDGSVIGLWTKIPDYGDKMCICSSLKDALCLWANIGIPSVYLQGEGYSMSETAINELKRRYKKVYICLDNDEPGLKDAEKLSKETGFTNVILPKFAEGKDIADYMKAKGLEVFNNTISKLFLNN